MNAQEMKKLVRDGMNAILYEHSEAGTRAAFSEDFIQHNPFSADGIDHLLAIIEFTFVWEPARWIIDGDIVAYHGMYTSTNPLDPENPLLCVDMWRVEDGKIIEHWDSLTVLPFNKLASRVAGGGDGLKEVSAGTVTANKATAQRYMDEVLQNGNTNVLADLLADNYVYHDDSGEIGVDGLKGWIGMLGGKVPHEVKRIIGSGDLVLVHSHFTHPDFEVANFTILCFDDAGKISEQWTAFQPIEHETDNPHPHF